MGVLTNFKPRKWVPVLLCGSHPCTATDYVHEHGRGHGKGTRSMLNCTAEQMILIGASLHTLADCALCTCVCVCLLVSTEKGP